MERSKGIQIWQLLHEFFRNKSFHKHSESATGLETRVMYIITRHNSEHDKLVSISFIKAILNVSSPTVSQVINELVRKGYVERVTDESDKRITRIKLLKDGKAAMAVEFKKLEDKFVKLAEHLGDEKSEQFISLLEEVVTYMKETGE